MEQRKAQIDGRGIFLIFIAISIISLVGLLIFSNVTNTTDSLFPRDLKHTTNESLTIISLGNGDNSTLLAEDGYITNSETVVNGSTGAKVVLTRDVDYKIILFNGLSGELPTRGNFTLLNVTNGTTGARGFNNTALKVTYDTNEKSASHLTKDKLTDDFLDSFELAIVGLIVFAAVLVLGFVYSLSKQ